MIPIDSPSAREGIRSGTAPKAPEAPQSGREPMPDEIIASKSKPPVSIDSEQATRLAAP